VLRADDQFFLSKKSFYLLVARTAKDRVCIGCGVSVPSEVGACADIVGRRRKYRPVRYICARRWSLNSFQFWLTEVQKSHVFAFRPNSSGPTMANWDKDDFMSSWDKKYVSTNLKAGAKPYDKDLFRRLNEELKSYPEIQDVSYTLIVSQMPMLQFPMDL
jgi:hypothetical protein